jgi:lipopolysaccharide export system protein LptA
MLVAGERRHSEMKAVRFAFTAIFVSAGAGAQGLTRCNLDAPGGVSSELVGNLDITRGGGGITVKCPSRNITLQADSGEMFGNDRVELYGRVHYDEPTRIDLRSDRLTYVLREEMVIVRGNVVATQPNGSRLTSGEATYFRAVPRVRTIEELSAIKNPQVTIAARNKNEKPITVNATTIYMRGDSMIYAGRSVVIDRADLIARADSAFLDGRANSETMRLMFKPSVEGREGRKFKLEGEVIDAYSKDKKLQRVVARASAHAVSQDLDLVADTIDLHMSNDAMERAIAWSRTGQARASSPGQVITADSIDARLPGQKVRVVYAVRGARAESDADSTRFKTEGRDWLRGDTITAWFDSTGAQDTSKTPPIDRLLAIHRGDSAQAYYHMPASAPGCRDAAISYVRGREILVDFEKRKIGVVSVKDSVVGMYLEPKCQAPKDSVKGKPTKPPGAGGLQPATRR